jgi:hypothetical protein
MSVHIGNYQRIALTTRKAHEVTILRMKKGENNGRLQVERYWNNQSFPTLLFTNDTIPNYTCSNV